MTKTTYIKKTHLKVKPLLHTQNYLKKKKKSFKILVCHLEIKICGTEFKPSCQNKLIYHVIHINQNTTCPIKVLINLNINIKIQMAEIMATNGRKK